MQVPSSRVRQGSGAGRRATVSSSSNKESLLSLLRMTASGFWTSILLANRNKRTHFLDPRIRGRSCSINSQIAFCGYIPEHTLIGRAWHVIDLGPGATLGPNGAGHRRGGTSFVLATRVQLVLGVSSPPFISLSGNGGIKTSKSTMIDDDR